MPTSCIFQLDRLNPVYHSGEYINGRILLKTTKVKRVNAVYVTLEGEAKVHWTMVGKSESANYHGYQQYLHTRVNVFDSTEFRAGTHVYVLTLRIPPDCPSSCKGPYGYIAYNISLTIDKPWSFDEIFHKPISVVQTLDLNFNPEYALPVKEENSKFLCSWPCSSGPISATLVLPFTGFTPSQEIPFFVEVDNQSPHYDVHGVEAIFRQHFVFLTRKPLKRNFYTKPLVRTEIEEPTLRLTKRLYEGNIYVPEDTPRSTLNTNYIVFLNYTLQVKLKTGLLHYDIEISLPIVIGTVPLQRQNILVTAQPTTRNRNLPRTRHRDPTVRSTVVEVEFHRQEEPTEDNPDAPPSYDSCLPPSFSYATLGSQQTLDDSGAASSQHTAERQRIRINLPKFPGYNTFVASANSINLSSDSVLNDGNLCYSYGSLDTDHTGRSLDTFGSSCGVLNQIEEQAADAEAEAELEDNL